MVRVTQHSKTKEKHPMKPHRLALTNELVLSYNLHKKLEIYDPRPATEEELMQFHSSDYVQFLKSVTPLKLQGIEQEELTKFNIGDDCPIFDNLFKFVCQYTGASLEASRKLISGECDIAINWSGGLHHAKKMEASGFCYINDIVLAILNMLRTYPRVLYIDIDVHHGDGVQDAFYTSDRVFTVSFHKYDGKFFPATGDITEEGFGLGKYYSLNLPLKDGIDDGNYVDLFQSVMSAIVSSFDPSVIVLQCGADSLGCDRLGCFNLSISAHGDCVDFIKRLNRPLLILGGGGYTIRNVARCWTYETSILVDTTLSNQLPLNRYREYFGPDFTLHPKISGRLDNLNTKGYIDKLKSKSLEYLRQIKNSPSVQLQEIPPDIQGFLDEYKNVSADQLIDYKPDDRLSSSIRATKMKQFTEDNYSSDSD